MKKTHLPELTIVFTCRIESAERLDNALAAIGYYQRYTDAPILVLEADRKTCLRDILLKEFPDVNYIFIEDSNEIFHRTHYINEEFRKVMTQNAAVIDVDIIVPPQQLEKANNMLLANEENVMVIPYDGRAVCQDACRTEQFCKSLDLRVFTEMPGCQRLMFGYISVGGAYLVNIERYRRCGWENEHFIGWGPEDSERFTRLDILEHKPLQLPGVIYHLEHPRGINSGDQIEEVTLATKREYSKVCSMMPSELCAYIKKWPWTN